MKHPPHHIALAAFLVDFSKLFSPQWFSPLTLRTQQGETVAREQTVAPVHVRALAPAGLYAFRNESPPVLPGDAFHLVFHKAETSPGFL